MAKSDQQPQGSNPPAPTQGSNPPTPNARRRPVVEVICEGFLGTKLLKQGDRTSDPEYVALIGDPRNLVKEVE